MKIDIKKLPKSEIEMMIIVPSEEWREFIDEAAAELSRDLKIEGFRPGFAPLNMIEARLGSEKILEEAAEHCVRKCYVNAVLNNNIEAIGRPEISVTKIPALYRTEGSGTGAKDPEAIPSGCYGASNPFEFKARVAVMPEVILPDYRIIAKNSQSDKKEVLVNEGEVLKSLEWLQKSRTKYATVARPCQAGDRIEIDFEGECEGKKLAELTSKSHPAILGRGYFMPGFEENLLGMKEGEEKRFNLVFREDFEPKNLSGKMAEFAVKMNLVQEGQLPELDDVFAQGLGNFKDLAALKENVRTGLLAEKREQERDRWHTRLIEEIAKRSEMEIPDILIEEEVHRMLDDLKNKITQIGLTFEQYLSRFQKTESGLHEEFEKVAEQKVRAFLTIRQIAKDEKIEVAENELAEEMNLALKRFGQPQDAEKNIDREQLKEYAKEVLRNRKVFQLLET